MTTKLPPGPKALFLIDGSSYLYRAFFAIRQLATSTGEPTNAIYGFAAMLRKLRTDHQPDLLAVAFDLRGPTERHEAFENYKANRKPMPDDLASQIEPIKDLIRAHRIPILERQGQEADDVMGSAAHLARAHGLRTVLVTSDKDLLQLVDGEWIWQWHTGKEEMWGPEQVRENWGVDPTRIIDILAIMGDTSDNVPGVKGIGEKGAKELVSTLGTLEAIYADLERVEKKAHRTKLEADRTNAELSKRLVTIRTDLDLELDWSALEVGEPDRDRLLEIYRRWELKTLAEELAAETTATSRPELDSRWAADPTDLPFDGDGPVAIHVVGQGGWTEAPVAAAVATSPERVYLLSLDDDHGPPLARAVSEQLCSTSRPWWSDDAKAALHRFALLGADLPAPAGDLGIASYVLDPGRRGHAFADVRLLRRGVETATARDVLGREGWPHLPPDELAAEGIDRLLGEPAAGTLDLLPDLEKEIRDQGLEQIYRDIELPLLPILARLERHGILLDTEFLAELSTRLDLQLAKLETRIHAMAGEEFNINSPKQLGQILFEKLGYPPARRTAKTKNYSTGSEVLEGLADSGADIAARVLEWRELQKLKGTYVDALPRLVDADGVLHSSFHQTVAATGRLSSSDPNLQNIPVRTELGREIRRAFVARPGHRLVCADYSQIELRLLAHFSGDSSLLEAFAAGVDIHAATAARVFGISPDLVSPDQRRSAKTINFGILYGMGAFSLGRDLGISSREAKSFIDSYFDQFPTIRSWLDETLESARQEGAVRTLFGRIRRIPELASSNHAVRSNAERMAVNAPLQGTAADLMKLAMIRVAPLLVDFDAHILLTVHDELVIEAPEKVAEKVSEMACAEMAAVAQLDVPLVVDIGVGTDWLAAKA